MRENTRKGIISIEVIVSIGLLMTFIGIIGIMGSSFAKLNDSLWMKHTCMAAGQAQLDAIARLGEPISPEEFSRLWPNVKCSIERTDGEGQWAGLERVEVHLTTSAKRKTVRLDLSRYMTAAEVRP